MADQDALRYLKIPQADLEEMQRMVELIGLPRQQRRFLASTGL
jgi:hypothetical protein